MLMKFKVRVFFTITYCIVRSKVLEFEIFYFDFRFWKLVLSYTNFHRVSHCANFVTLFNIATCSFPFELIFGSHYFYNVLLDCLFRKFSNLHFFFEIYLFLFRFLNNKYVFRNFLSLINFDKLWWTLINFDDNCWTFPPQGTCIYDAGTRRACHALLVAARSGQFSMFVLFFFMYSLNYYFMCSLYIFLLSVSDRQ